MSRSADPILDAVPPAKAPERKRMSAEEQKVRRNAQYRARYAAMSEDQKSLARESCRAYYAANAEKLCANQRAHRAADPEKFRERQREDKRKRRAADPKRERDRERAYYADNIEKFRERDRARHARDKVKRNAQKRERHIANPEKARDASLKKNYGITSQQYDAMLLTQGGACANPGCKKPLSGAKKAHLDHDHVSGEIRGILCANCNVALGQVNDNVEKLRGLILYLQTHDLLGPPVGART